jgi:hypothetical protein
VNKSTVLADKKGSSLSSQVSSANTERTSVWTQN